MVPCLSAYPDIQEGGCVLRLIIYIITIAGLMLASGCGENAPGTVNASPGQRFELKAGQKGLISGEELGIRFLEVVHDSRCPKDVVCIWAGEVTVTVEITYRESLHQKTLVKSGAAEEYVSTDFQEYEIQFDVQPYPESGKTIRQEDYFLKLIVNKANSLP